MSGRALGESDGSQNAAPGVLGSDDFAQLCIAYRFSHRSALRRHPSGSKPASGVRQWPASDAMQERGVRPPSARRPRPDQCRQAVRVVVRRGLARRHRGCVRRTTAVLANVRKDDDSRSPTLRTRVGTTGFEPATLWPPARCATKLRHVPSGRGYPTAISPGESGRSHRRTEYRVVTRKRPTRSANPGCGESYRMYLDKPEWFPSDDDSRLVGGICSEASANSDCAARMRVEEGDVTQISTGGHGVAGSNPVVPTTNAVHRLLWSEQDRSTAHGLSMTRPSPG